MTGNRGSVPESVVREIRRSAGLRTPSEKTWRKFSSDEKIQIVLELLRGGVSIAKLCRRGGISPNLF